MSLVVFACELWAHWLLPVVFLPGFCLRLFYYYFCCCWNSLNLCRRKRTRALALTYTEGERRVFDRQTNGYKWPKMNANRVCWEKWFNLNSFEFIKIMLCVWVCAWLAQIADTAHEFKKKEINEPTQHTQHTRDTAHDAKPKLANLIELLLAQRKGRRAVPSMVDVRVWAFSFCSRKAHWTDNNCRWFESKRITLLLCYRYSLLLFAFGVHPFLRLHCLERLNNHDAWLRVPIFIMDDGSVTATATLCNRPTIFPSLFHFHHVRCVRAPNERPQNKCERIRLGGLAWLSLAVPVAGCRLPVVVSRMLIFILFYERCDLNNSKYNLILWLQL